MTSSSLEKRLDNDRPLSLPVAMWPEADRTRWLQLIRESDSFDLIKRLSHWSSATRRYYEQGYGQWLGWLRSQNLLDVNEPPGDRLNGERVVAFVDSLRMRLSPWTTFGAICGLEAMLSLMAPDRDWRWLRALRMRLKRECGPSAAISAKIRPIGDLLRCGLRTMERVECGDIRATLDPCTRYRDGLMVALLAARPLRLGNFTRIALGQNLVPSGAGYRLVFSQGATKNDWALDMAVPDSLVEPLRRYVDHYRPRLLARAKGKRDSDYDGRKEQSALWIGSNGAALTSNSVADRIRLVTREELGIAIRPHIFRHCAATSIAREDPHNIHIAAIILGHRSVDISLRHYDHSPTLDATRRYRDLMLDLRMQLLTRDPIPEGFPKKP